MLKSNSISYNTIKKNKTLDKFLAKKDDKKEKHVKNKDN
jgi:hypothetical protein|tara:strand:+ start:574 stop:690 length:117 start_codon:yes stop_codon:yes gene_type:complete